MMVIEAALAYRRNANPAARGFGYRGFQRP
jgi:hypothetical protein